MQVLDRYLGLFGVIHNERGFGPALSFFPLIMRAIGSERKEAAN
jgi:hypothetical protein